MGKDKKWKKKHRSQKRRSDGDVDDDSSSLSEFDEAVIQNLKSIGSYVKHREEMVNQMFESLHGNHLKSIMPDVLKALPMNELKQMCVNELEGMSKKRIRCILAGEEMTSSSGTEDSSSENEEEIDFVTVSGPATLSVENIANQLQDEEPIVYQQPDSTSADLDPGQKPDDFGLEEPYGVDIILEEPSPTGSPETNEQQDGLEETVDNCQGSPMSSIPELEDKMPTDEKEDATSEEPKPECSGDRMVDTEESDNDDSDSESQEESEVEDSSENSNREDEERTSVVVSSADESDLEEGEIPKSPQKLYEKIQTSPDESAHDCGCGEVATAVDGVRNAQAVINSANNQDATGVPESTIGSEISNEMENLNVSAEIDNGQETKQEDTVVLSGAAEKEDDSTFAQGDFECEDDEGDAALVFEVQAQDTAFFGEAEASGIEVAGTRSDDDELLEFVEEPISKSNCKQHKSADGGDVAGSFTWCQQASTKPKIVEQIEDADATHSKGEDKTAEDDAAEDKTAEDDAAVEHYDDDGWAQETVSANETALLPPGFEPTSTSLKRSEGITEKSVSSQKQEEPTSNTGADSKKTKTSSILPIRTLYNQLKRHKMATSKKPIPKPKVYGPSPWKRTVQEPAPSGPALPPDTSANEAAIAPQDESQKKKPQKKPKKKTTSHDVLTPEFLAELERKRLEHEREMKEKMDMLKNLKAKRQKVVSRERDVEEELKKQLELGLFSEEGREKALTKNRPNDEAILMEMASTDSGESTARSFPEAELDDPVDNIVAVVDGEEADRQSNFEDNYLLVISDDDRKSVRSMDSVTSGHIVSTEALNSDNRKFPPIMVSISASTSGKLVRSVKEKSGDAFCDEVGKRQSGEEASRVERSTVRSTIGVVHNHSSKQRVESSRSRSRSSSQDRHRNRSRERSRERYHHHGSNRRDRHAYGYQLHIHQRSPVASKPERHEIKRTKQHSPDDMRRYRPRHDDHRGRRHEGDYIRHIPEEPERFPAPVLSPALPGQSEVDESFQRQAELLELELRAKAIRSLMKVQDEEKTA